MNFARFALFAVIFLPGYGFWAAAAAGVAVTCAEARCAASRFRRARIIAENSLLG